MVNRSSPCEKRLAKGVQYMANGKHATRWRFFDLLKIKWCTVTEHTFEGSRGTPRQRHHLWHVLYARVE